MVIRYYINGDEISEPIGFDSFTETLKRTQHHGVVRSISVQPLEFYGEGFDIVSSAYNTDIDTVLLFEVFRQCDGEENVSLIFSGIIDLSTYEEKDCRCRCRVGEKSTTETIFNNRSETVVNVERLTTLDGDALSAYSNINRLITVPAKGIKYETKVNITADSSDSHTWSSGIRAVDVNFNNTLLSEIQNPAINKIGIEVKNGINNGFFFVNIDKKTGLVLNASIDLSFIWSGTHTGTVAVQHGIAYTKEGDDTTFYPIGSHPSVNIPKSTQTNITHTSTNVNIPSDAYKLLYYVVLSKSGATLDVDIVATQKGTSFASVTRVELKQSTTSRISLVHELLSRTSEIISGLTVKSDWFGRQDSEINPRSSGYGGGSMKAITTGMKLRNGLLTDGSVPILQTSFRDLFENLTAIDNLGWSFEYSNEDAGNYTLYSIINDTITFSEIYENIHVGDVIKSIGTSGDISDLRITVVELVSIDTVRVSVDVSGYPYVQFVDIIEFVRTKIQIRVEPFDYFYQNTNVLTINNPAELRRTLDPSRIYSRLKIGYQKFSDTGEVNSIDTFHTQRDYSTRLKVVDNELVRISKFVACPYAIEFTRRKTFEPDTKDWRYDNDMFIFEVRRDIFIVPLLYGVKIGATDTDNTIISPTTLINVALSPSRNAINHLRLLFPSNTIISELQATGMIGNTKAKTKRASQAGALHADPAAGGILSENDTLSRVEPIYTPEIIEFEYPISQSDWDGLNADRYGLITVNSVPCWLSEASRSPLTGITKFKLIPKNV